jgi:dolichol kinase
MIVRAFDKIFETLIFRKLYHFAGGISFGLGIAFVSRWTFIGVGIIFALILWGISKRFPAAVLAIIAFYLIFPNTFVVLGAVIIFTVGDGFAAVLGSRYGKTRIPGHEQKTVVGSVGFFVTASVAMLFFVWGVTDASGWVLWGVGIMPAFLTTLIELIPLTPYLEKYWGDNLFLIWGAGFTILLLTHYFPIQTIWG